MSEAVSFIKVRKIGEKRFDFLRPNGSLTHLRIHAAMVPGGQAKERIARLKSDNPEFEFKEVVWK